MPNRRVAVRPATIAMLLAGAAAAGAGGSIALADPAPTPAAAAASAQIMAPPAAAVARAGNHASLADMVEAVGPSVVQVEAVGMARSRFGAQPRGSIGSGFIVDPAGLVITNNHVVDGASAVRLKMSDGAVRQARVLGRDPQTDLAVLRIDGGGAFTAVQWGDSDRLRVGESVFAVGSPFGLGNSVTAGIVSARGREIGAGPYDDFLQVDAAINSGNSGGPLFDANGRVVGVNTAIFSPSGGNVGIGFAIPAQLAQSIAREIVAKGRVERGQIGVVLADLTPGIASQLGAPDARGALIARIDPRGAAAASGLASGDIVRSFAGKTVSDGREFARLIADFKTGGTAPVTVVRQGRELRLNLRIGRG